MAHETLGTAHVVYQDCPFLHMQDFKADVIVATSMNLCAQVLASKLDKSFVNYFPAGPIDPFFTTIYPDSNRRAFLPNPLSYTPQGGSVMATQHMVMPTHCTYPELLG